MFVFVTSTLHLQGEVQGSLCCSVSAVQSFSWLHSAPSWLWHILLNEISATGTWVASTPWPLWMALLWTCANVSWSCLQYIPWSGIAGSCSNSLKFLRNSLLFSVAVALFYIPTNSVQEFGFSAFLPTLNCSSGVTYPSECEVIVHWFICIYPVTYVEHPFLCWLTVCVLALEKYIQVLDSFFSWVCVW